MHVPEEIQEELDELDPIEVTRLLGVQRPAVEVPPGALDPETVERRALLAAALVPAMFPAATGEIALAAAGADLPEDLRTAIDGLAEQSFANVQELWVALGGPVEVREGTLAAEVDADDVDVEASPVATRAPARGFRPDRSLGAGVARTLTAVRGLASVPLATGGAACTLGAAVLQRAAEDLTNLATRVSGVRG